MRPQLWRHQRAAIDFAKRTGSCLFHMGMGTGKTLAATVLAEEQRVRRLLVVAPKSVLTAWLPYLKESERGYIVLPMLRGTAKAKAKALRTTLDKCGSLPVAVVVNYETARSDALMPELCGFLGNTRPTMLVLDESHKVKAPKGKAARAMHRLGACASQTIGLTGTPMPHSPLDIWSQMRAIEPRVFGPSYYRFRNRYAVMGGYQGKQVLGFRNMPELRARLGRYAFQAGREVLDLPPATHNIIGCELSARARKVYRSLKSSLMAEIEEGTVTATNALTQLLRLQQVTSGALPLDGDDADQLSTIDNSKRDALVDLFDGVDELEPFVVFGRFRHDLDVVREAARMCGRGVGELSGRANELAAWQRGDFTVLAVQLQAGGVGVDMTRASYCAFLSTGFSLGDYEQALARVHRPGQDRPVHYYHLVCTDTIDEAVRDALARRRSVVEAVLEDLQAPSMTALP